MCIRDRAYLARCGVPHVTDATNDTDAYARNRIRHGEVGKVDLGWDGAHTRFTNVDYAHG